MAPFCLMAALLLALSAQAAPAVEKVANGVTADNEKLAVEKASNSHVPSHVPGVHRMKVRRVKLPADHPLLKQQQKNGIGHFFSQLAKKGGAAPGEEILPVTQDVWGILGVVDIQLGTPPQEFTFWLDPNSPDMFVLSEDVVDVQGRELTDERNEFNPRRSKSFSDASSRPWSQTCEGAAFAFSGNECMVASGRNATDMLRIGEMARKMNFGLVDRVDVMQSGYKETTAFPDFFGIDGKLGLSGMRPTSGIPSALEQLEPLMVQPMFTFFTYPDDFTETELVLGSDEIEGRCASMDYQHFPVTQLSAGPTAARHAWLQSVGIKYTGENATNSWVFRTGAWFAFYQMTPYSQDRTGSIPIYGPEWAVRQIANSINGTATYGEGFYTLPCDVRHLSSPSIVLTFGGRGQPSGQWTLRPKDYVLGPYKDSKSCYLAFTYNKGGPQDYQGPQDAWFSWEQHTGFCVNYNFQAGTMGIATPTF